MPPPSSTLRAVVVGAGAWGLPAAAELASRGWRVTLFDALEADPDPRSPSWHRRLLGSSAGPTRIWRLAHPDRARVRLARRAVEGWRRLERDALGPGGAGEIAVARGILWRDERGPLSLVADALRSEGVAFEEVEGSDVGSFFPGMEPDKHRIRDAVWQPEAGIVLAERAMRAHAELFAKRGGETAFGERVVSVDCRSDSAPVRVKTDRGRVFEADAAVVAPGTGATELFRMLCSDNDSPTSTSSPSPPLSSTLDFVSRRMRPRLQQTAHVSRAPLTDSLPCWYDGPREEGEEETEGEGEVKNGGGVGGKKEKRSKAGLYAMPTPGVGYKIGIDTPVRFLGGRREGDGEEGERSYESGIEEDDGGRRPSEGADREIEARARESLPGLMLRDGSPLVHSSQVCCWTDSPDGRFVVGRPPGLEGVVVAAGCSGEGFKFSALMGTLLADLAEGREPDEDVAPFGFGRFVGAEERATGRHVLGR